MSGRVQLTVSGFLEQGLVVKDIDKIRKKYYESKQFKYDVISVIPADYVLGEALVF